jgi:NADH:ubiquinone oxidoreductase subunit 4 (subunit M)
MSRGGFVSVALAVGWRNVHNYFRNPAMFVPGLLFPLFFFTAFAGGLSRVDSVPGFDFEAGYTAFVYGFAGSLRFSEIDAALGARVGQEGLLLAGVGLMAVGLLFKIGAVPFHAWTPDVYQGAPTPVTAFMAACTKIAAF